ncbi:MAG: hypothetical protein Q4F38_07880 [Akkermansia sp.]|nr:hypothetical protein [Akkermansia sp.]
MKMHRFLATLFLAAPLCLADTTDTDANADLEADYEEEDYGEDYEDPGERTYTEAEIDTELQKLSAHFQKRADLLDTVKDLATADAAAEAYGADFDPEMGMQTMRILSQLHETNADKARMFITSLPNIPEKITALQKVYFYGSKALAKAVTGSEEAALKPQPITPEVQAALAEKIQAEAEEDEDDEFTLNDQEITLTGGPGLTRETAWVSSASDSESARIHAHHIAVMKIPGRVNPVKASQQVVDGKVYRCISIEVVRDDTKYLAEVWVDVSAGCKAYSPEQQKAVLDKLCDSIRKASELMRAVKDKASADAFADYMKSREQLGLTDEEHEILSSIDDDKIRECTQDLIPSSQEQQELKKKFIENNYYGSEKLKEL